MLMVGMAHSERFAGNVGRLYPTTGVTLNNVGVLLFLALSGDNLYGALNERAADLKRQKAKDLLESLTRNQMGEYLALVNVARGYTAPHEFAANANAIAAEVHHIHYLLEKLGNGYFRKALGKFGVVPKGVPVVATP